MADNTKIEWTEATWNPITGCTVVSPGCTNCYAMRLAGTRLAQHPSRAGLTRDTKAGPVWTGEVRFNEEWLHQPLKWKRPRMIFVCAHGDLFAEAVPRMWIERVFAIMALAPPHTFQVLTKRAARMREIVSWPDFKTAVAAHAGRMAAKAGRDDDATYDSIMDGPWPLPNVWLGVSVEDQKRADERIPDLLATPAAVRWISAEPLLGPVSLVDQCNGHYFLNSLEGLRWHDNPDGVPTFKSVMPPGNPKIGDRAARLDWVVVGGESGPAARPMHPDWARSLRDQCATAGVPFFFKQWGEWGVGASRDTHAGWRPGDLIRTTTIFGDPAWIATTENVWSPLMERFGKAAAGRLLDGVEHNDMPEPRP
ncbi:hypothetical protein [Microcystis phage vB_MweS-yong2]|nr:hypothetical protein [Microcystis phage vB_MweS-yong2]